MPGLTVAPGNPREEDALAWSLGLQQSFEPAGEQPWLLSSTMVWTAAPLDVFLLWKRVAGRRDRAPALTVGFPICPSSASAQSNDRLPFLRFGLGRVAEEHCLSPARDVAWPAESRTAWQGRARVGRRIWRLNAPRAVPAATVAQGWRSGACRAPHPRAGAPEPSEVSGTAVYFPSSLLNDCGKTDSRAANGRKASQKRLAVPAATI